MSNITISVTKETELSVVVSFPVFTLVAHRTKQILWRGIDFSINFHWSNTTGSVNHAWYGKEFELGVLKLLGECNVRIPTWYTWGNSAKHLCRFVTKIAWIAISSNKATVLTVLMTSPDKIIITHYIEYKYWFTTYLINIIHFWWFVICAMMASAWIVVNGWWIGINKARSFLWFIWWN